MAKHSSTETLALWPRISFAFFVLMFILAYALVMLGVVQKGTDVTRGWNSSVHTTVSQAVIPPER